MSIKIFLLTIIGSIALVTSVTEAADTSSYAFVVPEIPEMHPVVAICKDENDTAHSFERAQLSSESGRLEILSPKSNDSFKETGFVPLVNIVKISNSTILKKKIGFSAVEMELADGTQRSTYVKIKDKNGKPLLLKNWNSSIQFDSCKTIQIHRFTTTSERDPEAFDRDNKKVLPNGAVVETGTDPSVSVPAK